MFQLFLRIAFCLLIPILSWAQSNSDSSRIDSSSKKVEGDASLLTNYIWCGLTQTKLNPAIQSSIFYNFNQTLRFGAWGSNVNYYNSNKANSLLKLKGDIFVPLSPDTSFGIHYSDNHYFESDDRDGNTVGLNFEAYKYNILYEQESNWQRLGAKSKYLRVRKVWDVFGNWKWENHIGYTQIAGAPFADYFDLLSGIGFAKGAFSWQVGFTGTSNNSQFGSYADNYIYLLLKASY